MFATTAILSALISSTASAATTVDVYELSEENQLLLEVTDIAGLLDSGIALAVSEDNAFTTYDCTADVDRLQLDCAELGAFPVMVQSTRSTTYMAIDLSDLPQKTGESVTITGIVTDYAHVVDSIWGWLFGYDCAVEDSDTQACKDEASRRYGRVIEECKVWATAEFVGDDNCDVSCHIQCPGGGMFAFADGFDVASETGI